MTIVTITEYDKLAFKAGTAYPLPAEPPSVTQSAITSIGSSASSSAFAAGTKLVRLSTDTALHFLVGAKGATPTATTSCSRLPAGGIIDLFVPGGAKVAVIAAA